MPQTRTTSAYDFTREMHALRAQEMTQMIAAVVRSLFSRKPVLQPSLG